MSKPKRFTDSPLFVRLEPGTRERMDALRGDTRIGDFARDLIGEALDAREAAEHLPANSPDVS